MEACVAMRPCLSLGREVRDCDVCLKKAPATLVLWASAWLGVAGRKMKKKGADRGQRWHKARASRLSSA
eukprot:scaffold13297_cov146-Isochrysis_galbana.AAC.3